MKGRASICTKPGAGKRRRALYAGARAVVGAAILVGRVRDHCVAAGQPEVDRGRGRGEREREDDAAHGCEAGDGVGSV